MSQPARPRSEPPATLLPVEEVGDDATVLHFDQLSDRAQEAVVAAASDGVVLPFPGEFSRGDVIVFTDYYRVS